VIQGLSGVDAPLPGPPDTLDAVTHTGTLDTAAASGPGEPGPTDVGLTGGIEAALAVYLEARTAEASAIDPHYAAAADELSAFVLGGGKRIRPTFAWWGWRGAGGSVDAPEALSVLRAVSSLELIQACALVHDDLMDASALRRGKPTVHVAFARKHAEAGWHGRPARFGAAAAILLGDLALVWADDMFHTCGLPPEAMARAGGPWRSMRTELLGGQYLDVLHQATRDASQSAALRIDRYKTAAYTVERPLHLGAALAGAPPELVDGYRRFGADIGVAFQLRDDLLGVFGDPAVTGKPAGDDLREGKRTLLLAIALERADRRSDAAARAAVESAIGDPELTAEQVERTRGVLVELGAVQAVEQRIAALTGSALDALAAAPVTEPAATELAELAVTATRRRR
jgi:geranylgeranyl diphosphate synthase type I